MLLFFHQMFLMRVRARTRARVCMSVVHWHCTAQLSMFNMEKRFRNKIIIIIIIIPKSLSQFRHILTVCQILQSFSHIFSPFPPYIRNFPHIQAVCQTLKPFPT